MKNILFKIFFIFAFILKICVLPVNANFLEITSISFDNSGAFMTLDSNDNLEYKLDYIPDIKIDEDKKEIYFEIQPARIAVEKSFVVDSPDIFKINVKQVSTNPDIVGTTITYKDYFNPQLLTIKRLHNTFFIKFKNFTPTSYYFQDVYKESSVLNVDEKVNIQQILQTQNNIVDQINSAFSDSSSENHDNNDLVFASKNLFLKSKYYINSITLKAGIPILNGFGNYIISKPIYLTNPNRVAFDIKNSVANPLLRNRDIQFGNDTIRIGQFDHNTVRVVITSENPSAYTPVIYGESSQLGFINSSNVSPLNLYSYTSNMTSVSREKNDKYNYAVKFSFSKPIVFGVLRTSEALDLNLYNLNNYYAGATASEVRATPIENIKFSTIKSGGVKIHIPVTNKDDKYDVFVGADGKTLRIKIKTAQEFVPTEIPISEEVIVPAPVQAQKHTDNKRYVVIDAGHGGSDCGAIRDGLNEKDITLDISKRVQKLLEQKGYVVAMTRTDDTYVSLQDRVDYSEIFNPDIFVSIHVNSSNSQSPCGIETHYYKENSLKLAKYIHASMLNHINAKDRGLFKSKFYVINHTTAPAILVEIGFISNPNERVQLITESRKNATVKAIVEGIDDYFKK